MSSTVVHSGRRSAVAISNELDMINQRQNPRVIREVIAIFE
jgi:hypothetical protein